VGNLPPLPPLPPDSLKRRTRSGRPPGRPRKEAPDPLPLPGPMPRLDPSAPFRAAFTSPEARELIFLAWAANLQSPDPRARDSAIKLGIEINLGKPRAEGELVEPTGTAAPKTAGDVLAAAQESLETSLARLVVDLESKIKKGWTGTALLKDAGRAAELLKELLAQRLAGGRAAGLPGQSTVDIVLQVAARMAPDERAKLREQLAVQGGLQ